MVFVGRSQTLNFEVRALQNLYISFKTLYFQNSLIIILHNGGFGLFTEYFQILRRAGLTPGDARSPPTAPKTIAVYISEDYSCLYFAIRKNNENDKTEKKKSKIVLVTNFEDD